MHKTDLEPEEKRQSNADYTKDAMRERTVKVAEASAQGVINPPLDLTNTLDREPRVLQVDLDSQKKELKLVKRPGKKVSDQFAGLYDQVPVACFTLSYHSVIKQANLAAGNLLGMDRTALLGSNFCGFIVPDFVDAFNLNRRQTLKYGGLHTLELKINKTDGTTMYCRVESVGLRQKSSWEMLVTAVDISRQKKIQVQSEFKCKLLDAVGESVIATDPGGHIIYWGDGATRLYGWQSKEVMGKHISEVIGATNQAENSEKIMESLAKGETWSGEYMVRRRDGREIPILLNDSPVKGEAGNVIALLGISRDISDLKRKEAELLIKDQAIASAMAGIGITDLSGTLIYANRALVEMGGYNEEDVIGKNAFLFFEDEKEVAMALSSVIDNGSWEGELRSKKKDGSFSYVHVWANRVVDRAGKPVCLMATLTDVSEQKKIAELTKWQAMVLNTVMENTGTMLAYFDRDFNFIMANKAYLDNCGHTWEELKGKSHFYYFPDDDNEAIFRKVRDTGEAVTFHDKAFEYNDQPWRGITYWDWTLVPIKDDSGKVSGMVLSLTETTGRRKMEMELAHLASFPELSPIPIIEVDEEGKLKYLNPVSRGFSLDLSKDNTSHPFLSDWEALVNRFRSGESSVITREIPIGQRWHEEMITYLPSKQIYRIYIRDITERKQVEDVKDEFIGLVSHELKTPLTIIIGALSVAIQKGISKRDSGKLIQDAANQANSLSIIVENLLELSRYQARRLTVQTEPIKIKQLIRDVIAKFRFRSAKHKLTIDVHKMPASIIGDRVRIERILYNLLDNAIKYSPNGGEVRVSAQERDNKIVIGVSDQGIGITPGDRWRLFQSFERIDAYTTNSVAGAGLGLKVCRILVEYLGGRIWVETEPGKGSTFFFTLPLRESR